MRYIVTGGAGFIGSNIAAELEGRGFGPIAVVDELEHRDQWRNLAKRSLHAIVSPRDMWPYLETCADAEAIVFHMAGRTSTMDDDADALVETNAMLTARLFEYCALRNWPFIYASSASVYGSDADQTDHDDLDALARLKPLNPYAWSKALADKMVAIRAKGGLNSPSPPRWAGLRFFNVYGPNESHKGEQMSFISRCFDMIRAGQPIRLYRGSENFRRDWVYSIDCARLAVDLMTEPDFDFTGIYNVGSGAAASYVEAAAACIEASGRLAPVVTVPFPDELYGRYQARTQADTAKLKTLVPGFEFSTLKQGIGRYWQAYAARDGMGRYP